MNTGELLLYNIKYINMERIVIFEGKVTLADRLVDFRIYKHSDKENGMEYYSYATNPWLRNRDQGVFHLGETLRSDTLSGLLYRFMSVYRKEFTDIEEEKENTDF